MDWCHQWLSSPMLAIYPIKCAYGFVVHVLFCTYYNSGRSHIYYLPISFRVTSLALGQWYDCPSASEVTLMYMGKINQYQTTIKHTKDELCAYYLRCTLLQYIPRNMHTVFALLCFVVVIHRLIFPYPSGLLHWHCGNLTIAPVPAKQPWWIWINTSYEFIMKDCITTTKQSTTKPCAYFLGYTVHTCQITLDISRSPIETNGAPGNIQGNLTGIVLVCVSRPGSNWNHDVNISDLCPHKYMSSC